MPQGTATPSVVARATRATPKKVAFGAFYASLSNEERTLTDRTSRSARHEEGASIFLGVSWSEEASGSAKVPATATFAHHASSDEADNFDSTLSSPTSTFTLVVDKPVRWCFNGQYQEYYDFKFLNDKGFMTQNLTLERRAFTSSLPTMPEIDNQFTRHRFKWTARSLGCYTKELVPVFYAS